MSEALTREWQAAVLVEIIRHCYGVGSDDPEFLEESLGRVLDLKFRIEEAAKAERGEKDGAT